MQLCLRRTCEMADAYELLIDGLLRVEWMQVEGDVLMETVRVRVKCDTAGDGRGDDDTATEEEEGEKLEWSRGGVGQQSSSLLRRDIAVQVH